MVRFLGNRNTKEVHDLMRETTNCQISDILPQHKVYFTPDTLEEAHQNGYDNCHWCIGNSRH